MPGKPGQNVVKTPIVPSRGKNPKTGLDDIRKIRTWGWMASRLGPPKIQSFIVSKFQKFQSFERFKVSKVSKFQKFQSFESFKVSKVSKFRKFESVKVVPSFYSLGEVLGLRMG